MTTEPDADPWTDLEEALRAIRGVACTLNGMSDMSDGLAATYLARSVDYLGQRLDEHTDDARDAFDRLFALHHKKAEP